MYNNIYKECQVNREIATPLYKQLAQNLQWSISNGRIPIGKQLPTVRDMAKELGISVNTVRTAYKILEEQDLIVTRPKVGTVVVGSFNKNITKIPAIGQNYIKQHMYDMVKSFLSSEYSIADIKAMFEQVLESEFIQQTRVLFVECTEIDAKLLSTQLSNSLGTKVEYTVLDQLETYLNTPESMAKVFDAIVTTYFHYATVLKIVKNSIPVFGVVVEIGSKTAEYLASVSQNSKVGIICEPQHSTQYLLNEAKNIINKDIEIKLVFPNQTEELKELLSWGDIFFTTQTCKTLIERLVPNVPLFFFYDQINQQSIAMLKEYLYKI